MKKVVVELNEEQFAEMEFLLQDRVFQLIRGEQSPQRDKKLEIARSIIEQFPPREEKSIEHNPR